MSNTGLKKYLDHFPKRRIFVVGDLMVDYYLFGSVRRISPEAPVPVVNVTSESVLPGGAANVLHNILTLGGGGVLCGVVGQDAAGDWLTHTLKAKGAQCDGVFVDSEHLTTRKTRVVAHQQQVVRFDHERPGAISPKAHRHLTAALNRCVAEADCVVVSDYAKGVVTPGLMNAVRVAARARGTPIIVDPKVSHFARYKRTALITPNHLEAAAASGVEIVDEPSLRQAGATLLRKSDCGAVLITRGEQGMSLFERGKEAVHISTEARAVYDVTGAGDTVVATLALAVASGAPWRDAARLANIAAGLSVGIVGTAAISMAMLREALP